MIKIPKTGTASWSTQKDLKPEHKEGRGHLRTQITSQCSGRSMYRSSIFPAQQLGHASRPNTGASDQSNQLIYQYNPPETMSTIFFLPICLVYFRFPRGIQVHTPIFFLYTRLSISICLSFYIFHVSSESYFGYIYQIICEVARPLSNE